MPDPLAGINYGGPYPYTTGYASLADVQARISAGTWDPTDPTAYPTAGLVNGWLMEATASLDSVLASRGYAVPLVPMQGWVAPAGMPLYQGIGVQAWFLLRSIAAAYGTHNTEQARHGGEGNANDDKNASIWLTIYTDGVALIEQGLDNLGMFGAAGPFPPVGDPAKGLGSGSLGALMANPWRMEAPLFTKYENLGAGWERNYMGMPQSGWPASEE